MCPKTQVVVRHVMDWCQEFLRINHTPTSVDHRAVVPRWARPSPGRLKANVDREWVSNSIVGGVGMVIRDSNRGFIGATSFNF